MGTESKEMDQTLAPETDDIVIKPRAPKPKKFPNDTELPLDRINPKRYFTDEIAKLLSRNLAELGFFKLDSINTTYPVIDPVFEKFSDSGCGIVFKIGSREHIAFFGASREENSPTYRLRCEIRQGKTWPSGERMFAHEQFGLTHEKMYKAVLDDFFWAFGEANV